MTLKLFVLFSMSVIASTIAAPQPIDFQEIGRNIVDFGKKAYPVVRSTCGFITQFPPSSPQYGYAPPSYQQYVLAPPNTDQNFAQYQQFIPTPPMQYYGGPNQQFIVPAQFGKNNLKKQEILKQKDTIENQDKQNEIEKVPSQRFTVYKPREKME